MEQLGKALRPPRERKTISRYLTHSLCPGRTADGRYHIAKWQKFINAVGAAGHTDEKKKVAAEPAGINAELTRERIALTKAQRVEQERNNEVAAGLLIQKKKAGADITEALTQLKAALMQIPSMWAPVVISYTTPADAERYMRTDLTKLLLLLSAPKVLALMETEPSA